MRSFLACTSSSSGGTWNLLLSGTWSGPPEMVSTVTSSPLSMVSTGFSFASKKPQWQVSGLDCR